ncbi:MAG: hypothetical protein H6Q90_61 [Deltaproteobacteria bacterium]|nr:hypothetical protein [Deltaproteobacteria bacterium]
MMRTPLQYVSGSRAALAVLASVALSVGGCKGETVIKLDPQTQTALDACNEAKKEKDKLIASLQEENTRLQTRPTGAEIVVTIEGNSLTVKPGKPGEVRPIDDKAAAEASKEFIDVVRKSRGAIQKCYEQALKKTTGLQTKTVTLTVSASFVQSGAYKTASFAPSLGDTFDTCIRAVASKWILPQNSPAMTFQTQVSLTPS